MSTLILLLSVSLIVSFMLRGRSIRVKCLVCNKYYHDDLITIKKVRIPENIDFLTTIQEVGVCIYCFFKDTEE